MNPYLHSEATTPASRRVRPARMAAGIAAFVMLLFAGPLHAQDAVVTISKNQYTTNKPPGTGSFGRFGSPENCLIIL